MHRSLLAALILLNSSVAHAALEFSGYLRSTDTLRFVLTDLESGTKSEWLTIGTIFQGHKVSAFDSEREILILEREGETVRLSLKDSRVRDGEVVLPAKVEMKVGITQEGTPVINGQPITFADFDTLLRKHAESATPLAFFFHEPYDPSKHVHETIKKLHHAIGRSGVKKWSIKIVDTPPPKK